MTSHTDITEGLHLTVDPVSRTLSLWDTVHEARACARAYGEAYILLELSPTQRRALTEALQGDPHD